MTSPPIVGLLLLCQLCIAVGDDVILSIVLHRHGSRGPEAFFPHGIDPNDGLWLDGQGLLTDLGN